jgi:hypothetical protein
MRRLAPLLTLLVLSTSLLGCSADEDTKGDGSSGTTGASGTGDALGGASGYSVTGALKELPYATPKGSTRVEVLTGSLEAATGLAGLERPTSTDPKKLLPWLRALNGDVTLPYTQSVGLDSINVDPSGKALGFTAADVRFFTELHDGGDRFSVETLYDGAKLNGKLPKSGDLRRTSDGKAGSLTRNRDLVVQFPKVNLIVQDGHRVAFSQDAGQVESWRAGKGKRLDKDATLTAVARALDAAKVYGAQLVRGRFRQAVGRPSADVIKERFDAVGVGFTLERQRPIVHVSYHFPGNATVGAQQVTAVWTKGTSRRARVPLSDYAKLTGIRTHGKVVTVKLDASDTGPQVVLRMLSSVDTPFQAG